MPSNNSQQYPRSTCTKFNTRVSIPRCDFRSERTSRKREINTESSRESLSAETPRAYTREQISSSAMAVTTVVIVVVDGFAVQVRCGTTAINSGCL